MVDGKTIKLVNSECQRSKCDKNYLKSNNRKDDHQEKPVFSEALENIELNRKINTSSWSLRAFKKLKICINTNVLKIKVKWREYT